MSPSHPETPDAPTMDMSITVGENTARIAGISRAASDEWALHSHLRAAASRDEGRFAEEIVPVEVPDGEGGTRSFARDEHPRADTTARAARVAAGAPPRDREAPRSPPATRRAQRRRPPPSSSSATTTPPPTGSRRWPASVSWASVGDEPVRTGLAPILAIPKALDRGGLPGRRHRPVRDQRGVLLVAVAVEPGARHRPRPGERQRQRLRPRSPDRRHRLPHGRDHAQRAAPPRRSTFGCVSMCAGGGMGSALVLELL